ncbi:MAG: PH domain-containing protein [Aliidongia sp.]
MASYVEESLVTNEHVVYTGALSKWPYFFRIILGIILAPILIGFIILIDLAIKFRATELAVTNRRVIAKFGVFRRKTFELNVDRVEAIQVDQGIWGRMLGYGTLRIAGAGNFDPIPNVSAPMAFKKAVLESQEAWHDSFAR